jgi:hypothetical protein
MLLGWLAVVRLAVVRLAGCCEAGCCEAGWLFDLAGWVNSPVRNCLPNHCLAGNPVTRIPDFVQP